MPVREDHERNEVGAAAAAAGRLTTVPKQQNLEAVRLTTVPKAEESRGIEGHMHPSVGRFTAYKIPGVSLEVTPVRVKPIDNIAARSIAPTCTYGVFNTQVLERPMKGPSYGPAFIKCTRQSPCALLH